MPGNVSAMGHLLVAASVPHGGTVVLVAAVFLASAVEMVEALTIVLAVGVTQGWKQAMRGVGVALAALAVLVVVIGPPLVHYVPLPVLRLVVGGLLVNFGLQWFRKAILRASGRKAKHDEDAIFAEQVEELSGPGMSATTGFVVAFKGVFLEGLEVVIIVLTLGSTSRNLGVAALAAAAAVLLVAVVGLIVARQLSSVPENAMKMAVSLMLVSFGTFWSGEGVGVHWPGSDAAIVVLVAFYGAVAAIAVRVIARPAPAPVPLVSTAATPLAVEVAGSGSGHLGAVPGAVTPKTPAWPERIVVGFGHFWWEFLVGETYELFVGVLLALGITFLLAHPAGLHTATAFVLPVLVVVVLAVSLRWSVKRRT